MGLLDIASSALASFASAFGQGNRLIALRFSEGAENITKDDLLPGRIRITESLSGDATAEVVCLSHNAYIDLKDYVGQPAEFASITG